MAGDWKELTLDQLGRIVTGKTPSSKGEGYFGGTIPFVTPTDFDGRRIITDTGRYLTERGAASVAGARIPSRAVMVTCIGSDMGKAAIAGRECVTNQQINSILVGDDNEPLFVYYNLSGRKAEIRSHASGSAQPILNKSGFGALEIALPPLREQQAIACILGALDDKIELNRQLNRTLEDIAQAIFKNWFVDFDPVRAKAAGQQPPGLKPAIAALFPDSFEDSDLGEIPKGWRIGKIDDIAYINTWTLGRRDTLEAIDYVEISEVMRGEVGKITRYIRGEEPSRARRRLKHGDTVLSTVRPDRGAHFLVLNPPESLIASTGFAVLTPKDGKWAFLHSATTRPEFGQELGRLADGGAYPAIRPEVVGGRDLVLPNNLNLIAAFDKIVQPLFLRTEASRNECRSLFAIRDTLLPKLVSGELRVKDAECIAGRYA